jgi:hypothetical protein
MLLNSLDRFRSLIDFYNDVAFQLTCSFDKAGPFGIVKYFFTAVKWSSLQKRAIKFTPNFLQD